MAGAGSFRRPCGDPHCRSGQSLRAGLSSAYRASTSPVSALAGIHPYRGRPRRPHRRPSPIDRPCRGNAGAPAKLPARRCRHGFRPCRARTLPSPQPTGASPANGASPTNVSLWSNQLQSIRHDAFSGLHELVELGLDGNALESLPEGLFAGMSRLSDLGSSGNRISSLPRSIFHGLSALHELSLDRNEIRSLYTDSFTDLGELTWLSIRENALESLPRGVFSNLSKLDYLLLDENRLETLPNGVFHGLSKLSNLGLSRNQPRSLPDDVFRRPGNLLRLSLDHNQLHSLPDGVFEGLVRLAYLHLSDNNLSALPQNVFGDLGNLRELDLWQNQLTTLPPGTFAGIDKLVRLNLDKNPGAPFALSIKLRQTDATSFVLEAPLGIPVAVVASLSATGGTLFESDRPGATSPGKVLSVVLPPGTSPARESLSCPTRATIPLTSGSLCNRRPVTAIRPDARNRRGRRTRATISVAPPGTCLATLGRSAGRITRPDLSRDEQTQPLARCSPAQANFLLRAGSNV